MTYVVFRTHFASGFVSYGFRAQIGKSCRAHSFTPAAIAEHVAGQLYYDRVAPEAFAVHVVFLETTDNTRFPESQDRPLTEQERNEFLAHLH